MYFETPDLRSSTGWRGMGAVNRERLYQFGSYCKARPTDSLLTLISDGRRIQGSSTDPRFQGPDATLNAYSEAWSLTYYLLKHKQKLFVEYLKFLGQKKPGESVIPPNSGSESLKIFLEKSSCWKKTLCVRRRD